MTDTPFSFTFHPSTWWGGDIAYSPPGSGRFIARNMKVVNTDVQRDAWLWVGDLSTNYYFDRHINGLPCPAGSTQIIELDLVGSSQAGNSLSFRQVADQTYSNIAVSSAVAAFTSGTDTTSYSTASWTSAADEHYVMTIAATGVGISSFTDTHTGVTWTLLQSANLYGSGTTMYHYAAKATGATSAVTTVNMSGTAAAMFISIVKIANVPTGVFSGEVVAPAGIHEYTPGSVSTQFVGMEAREVCGSRLLATMAQVTDATLWTPWGDYKEIHDAELTGEAQKYGVFYARTAGKSGWAFQGTPPTGTSNANDHLAMMVDIHDTYAPVWVTVDGVEVT